MNRIKLSAVIMEILGESDTVGEAKDKIVKFIQNNYRRRKYREPIRRRNNNIIYTCFVR